MIDRKKEIAELNKLYDKNSAEFGTIPTLGLWKS